MYPLFKQAPRHRKTHLNHLNLGTRWTWVVSFTTQPPYHLDKRLGGTQSRSECGGKEKNPFCTPVVQPEVYSQYSDWATPSAS